MAQYTINFSSNASRIEREIRELRDQIVGVAKIGKNITIDLNTQQFASTTNSLRRELQALEDASGRIAPNTSLWINFQREIGRVNQELRQTQSLAESIQLREQLGLFAPGSLAQLETRLTLLKNRAREISPDTDAWRDLNREIVKAEKAIERQTRKPLTSGQRLGAAGGALLYGGGLGGGIGSALGGIAGGLAGGVPGAFAGVALGQVADNLRTYAGAIAQTSAEINKSKIALAGVTKDVDDYDFAIKTATEAGRKFLIPITDSTRQFTKLQASIVGAGFDTQTTAKAFNGIAAAIIATGGSTQDLNGALTATAQVFSKGKVSAEELRGQIGERLPGAFTIFAQSIGKTPQELDKLLEEGKVTLNDFNKFIGELTKRYGATAEELAKAPENAGARLQVALQAAAGTFGGFFQRVGAGFQQYGADLLNFAVDNEEKIKRVVATFLVAAEDIYSVFSQLIKALAPLFGNFFNYVFTNFAKGINAIATLANESRRAAGGPEQRAAAAVERLYPNPIERALKGAPAYREALAVELKAEAQNQKQTSTREQRINAMLQGFKPTSFGAGLSDLPSTATGGIGSGGKKSKSAKELKEFVNDRIDTLRKRLEYEKAFIDADLNLLNRERVIEKARKDLSYGLQIIDEQVTAAQRESLGIRLQDRARFLAEMKTQADIERKTLRAQFATTVAGNLVSGNEQLTEQYQERLLTLENARRGQTEFTEAQKAELAIGKELMGLRPDEVAGIQSVINARMDLARSIDNVNRLLSKETKLQELQKQLRLASILDPRQELRERLRQENPLLGETDIEELAKLQEQVDKAQKFKEQMVSTANAIGDAFGESFKSIVSGSMTAQQALASFFQQIGDYFLDMVARMISGWLQAQAIKGFQSILSSLIPGMGGGSSLVQGFDVPIGQMPAGMAFANGGIAPGGFVPFQKFATGGIVSGPTLGLVGEGRYNEAVIPLPDGKSVPVDLGGSAGNQIISNITVNVSNGQVQSNATGANSSELGRKLEGVVKQVIIGELRPGGILSR